MGSCGSTAPATGTPGARAPAARGPKSSPPRAALDLSGAPATAAAYDVLSVLGKGAFGTVYAARRRGDPDRGALRALKVVQRGPDGGLSALDRVQLASERLVAQCPRHANLIRQYDIVAAPSMYVITYELCEGGEVMYDLRGRPRYTEGTVCVVVKALFRALAHLHDHGLAHLDVKPQNMVFARKPAPGAKITVGDVRLIDFGAVSSFTRDGPPSLTAVAGSPHFAAPEVLRHLCANMQQQRPEMCAPGKLNPPEPYDERCDVYSACTVAFIMLVGRHPFVPERVAEKVKMATFLTRVILGKMHLPGSFADISIEAQEVLRAGLATDFADRPSMKEMLRSPWLASCGDDEGGSEASGEGAAHGGPGEGNTPGPADVISPSDESVGHPSPKALPLTRSVRNCASDHSIGDELVECTSHCGIDLSHAQNGLVQYMSHCSNPDGDVGGDLRRSPRLARVDTGLVAALSEKPAASRGAPRWPTRRSTFGQAPPIPERKSSFGHAPMLPVIKINGEDFDSKLVTSPGARKGAERLGLQLPSILTVPEAHSEMCTPFDEFCPGPAEGRLPGESPTAPFCVAFPQGTLAPHAQAPIQQSLPLSRHT